MKDALYLLPLQILDYLIADVFQQKQPLMLLYKKGVLKNFCKIHRKTSVTDSKVVGLLMASIPINFNVSRFSAAPAREQH